jgi:hypothetical protein
VRKSFRQQAERQLAEFLRRIEKHRMPGHDGKFR